MKENDTPPTRADGGGRLVDEQSVNGQLVGTQPSVIGIPVSNEAEAEDRDGDGDLGTRGLNGAPAEPAGSTGPGVEPRLGTGPSVSVTAAGVSTEPTGPTGPSEALDSRAAKDLASRPFLPDWCGWLLLLVGLLTLPWAAGVAEVLPSRAEANHYDVSWAGFDVLLCVLLLRTGWSVLRNQHSMGLPAAMAGSLLIVDAWFDVMSAGTTSEFVIALAMGLFAEIPLAVFCLWIAGHVEFERRRRWRRLSAIARRREAHQGRRKRHFRL